DGLHQRQGRLAQQVDLLQRLRRSEHLRRELLLRRRPGWDEPERRPPDHQELASTLARAPPPLGRSFRPMRTPWLISLLLLVAYGSTPTTVPAPRPAPAPSPAPVTEAIPVAKPITT